MEESEYSRLAELALRRVVDAFDSIDPDDADVETAGDVVTITLPPGMKCVINTQRPTRQIWLAGGQRAWHFSYDADSAQWLDDKLRKEFFSVLSAIIRDASGLSISFATG